jgi:2-dehydro-3-deoxygluconokinase
MSAVVTFGEIMMRLTAPAHERFAQADRFEITFGGAEANVAVIIAQLGGVTQFVTRLPENPLGDRALTDLAARNVGVDHVVRGGDRLGLYFLEQGASQRPSQVLYDRSHSALATAEETQFDWAQILAGAAWFHWSGITPALSTRAAAIVAAACAAARTLGCKISFDMNYRAKLWSAAAAGETLPPLLRDLELCVCGLDEARTVFGVTGTTPAEVAQQLGERFGARRIAIPHRESATAGRTLWHAALFVDGEEYRSRCYDIEIVDRVGAGDALTGALIFALMRNDAPQDAIEFAAAAAALKHTIRGDYALVTCAEVAALAAGGDGGRVQR